MGGEELAVTRQVGVHSVLPTYSLHGVMRRSVLNLQLPTPCGARTSQTLPELASGGDHGVLL